MPEPEAPSSEVTKREPAQVTDPGDAATPEECVAAVHRAAERLNEALAGYGPEDWRDAARLLDRLRKATRVLAQLDSALVLWLYLHGEHGLHQHVDGIKGEVHITRGRSKERWAAPEAVHAYVDAQMEQMEGEVPDPRVIVDWVLAVVPATASTSLRKTPLRESGLDLEDFYSSEPGTIQVSL